jgi:hypothetical protein
MERSNVKEASIRESNGAVLGAVRTTHAVDNGIKLAIPDALLRAHLHHATDLLQTQHKTDLFELLASAAPSDKHAAALKQVTDRDDVRLAKLESMTACPEAYFPM